MFSRLSALGLVAGGLLSLSCSRAPTLLVTVDNLPPGALSLQVLATHEDKAAVKDLEPYDLPTPSPAVQTFLLHLPANFSGDVNVNVAAFDKQKGAGCILGTGVGALKSFEGTDSTLRVTLKRFDAAACVDGPTPAPGGPINPLIIAAEPKIGVVDGNEVVTLRGWGFKPGATVKMGSKNAVSVEYVSSSELRVTTPGKAGFNLVPVQVTNPDSTTTKRSDVFRFYTTTLRFMSLALFSGSDYATTTGFVIGHMDDKNKTELDAALVYTQNGNMPTLRVLRTNLTTATVISQKDYPVAADPRGLVMADLNQDGFKDFTVISAGSNKMQVLLNDGSNGLGDPLDHDVGANTQPSAVTVGDVDGNGTNDVVVAHTGSAAISVFSNNGKASFVHQSPLGTKVMPVGVAIGDLNQDKQPDIVVANGGMNVRVFTAFFNQGQGTFLDSGSGRFEPTVAAPQSNVLIRDIDYDGRDDAVFTLSSANKILLYMQRAGLFNFEEVTVNTTPNPQGIQLADVNGDGYEDLIVAGSTNLIVEVFLNNKGLGFAGVESVQVPQPKGNPKQVGVFDFNQDGLADIGVLTSDGVVGLVNQSSGS